MAKGESVMQVRCVVVLLFIVFFVMLCCLHVSDRD